MKVLLSSIGSRGDVQPILALALELQKMGHQAALCVAPDFADWIASHGVECIPIGPDLKEMTGGSVAGKPPLPPPKQLQRLTDEMVRGQFQVIAEAARGCDVVVAAGALQIATRSLAEVHQLPLGVSGPTRDDISHDTLLPVLREALRPEITARAKSLPRRVDLQGVRVAAERLVREFA
jgi:UDP:flavonoid glycosyltransferase YjiC (YdhE family)